MNPSQSGRKSRLSESQGKKGPNKALKNGRRGIDELGLQYSDDKKQINWLASIIGQYLRYPSIEEAQKHRRANKLGSYDIKTPEQIKQDLREQGQQFDIENYATTNYYRNSYKKSVQQPQQKQKKKKYHQCDCCGLTVQKQQIGVLTQLHHVNHLGMSTILYFMAIKNIVFLLGLMFITFSLFASVTNFVASQQYKDFVAKQEVKPSPNELSYQGFLRTALGSKHFLQNTFTNSTFQIQCWLGAFTIILWAFAFVYAKRQQKIYQDKVDYLTASAADFTLQLSGIPFEVCPQQDQQLKKYIEDQIIKYLNQVKQSLGQQNFNLQFGKYDVKPKSLKLQNVNQVSLYDLQKLFGEEDDDQDNPNQSQQQKKLNAQLKIKSKQIQKIQDEWRQLLNQKKKYNVKLDYDKLSNLEKQYQKLRKQKREIKKLINNKFQEKQDRKVQKISEFSAFVTFEDTRSKELIQLLHERQKSLYHKLPCFKKRKYLTLQNQQTKQKHQIKVQPAPQPEDIIWKNYDFTTFQRWRMRFVTFFVTILILCVSFFIVYFLTKVQINLSDQDAQKKSFASTAISFAISGALFVINSIISESINRLTKLERNTTITREQTSIGVKSIFAQLVNSIVIPIAVNSIIKRNIYGVDGLADDIFYQAVTFAILTPLLKVINPSFIIYYLKRWWKNRPWNRIELNQRALNKINEQLEFQVGAQYVQLVSMFLFACFFASLQPLVVLIVALGLLVLYYAQKFSLFITSKRPTPGNNEINTVLYYLIYCGPLFFIIGTYCWTNFLIEQHVGRIPNIITLITAIAILLAPYEQVVRYVMKGKKQLRVASFQVDKFIIPSDYQRLNPLTKKDAMEQFTKEKQNFLLSLKNKSKQQKQQLERRMEYQNKYGAGEQQQEQHQFQQQQYDDEPYFQIFINNSDMQTLQKQSEQLRVWLQEKEKDEILKEIPHYIYYGNYDNQEINVVQVNFQQMEQFQQQSQDYQFSGYNANKAEFQDDQQQQQQQYEESGKKSQQSQIKKSQKSQLQSNQVNGNNVNNTNQYRSQNNFRKILF